MSHSNHFPRTALSLALVLATAAITACGGGSTDSQASPSESATGDTGAPAEVATGAEGAASAAAETQVSTNGSAVAAVTQEDAASAPTTVATADTPAPPAAADTAASSVEATAQATHPTTVVSSGQTTAARPAGNTGTGFYVSGSKLYDANGHEFRIRGVNRVHYDNGSVGLPLSGANTERIALNFTKPATSNLNLVKAQILDFKMVPMPSNWSGTCKSDATSLTAIVDAWVAQAPTWTALNSHGIINIANEWGPPNSTFWRDSYIAAVARMRAAGYTGTLAIDSGGCGQDPQDIIKYGAAVLASDPQKNILFDVHVYGAFHLPAAASWQTDYAKSMAALKSTGLPIMLGEFGPGKNVGPSPTTIMPEQVIATAEAAGWGWMPWAWDDNNLDACKANDGWFSMTLQCGNYKTDNDLTAFGKAIVPILKATAVKATVF
jgi:mannan endo-1,4-beta-mannosidase